MNDSKKINKIRYVFLIFILLVIVCSIIFIFLSGNNNDSDNKKNNNKKDTENNVWLTPKDSLFKINIYSDGENFKIIKSDENTNNIDSNYNIISSYNCVLDSCSNYTFDEESKSMVIKDDGYIIYNYEDNKFKKLNIQNAEYSKIQILSYGGKNYGLAIADINGMYAFYYLKYDKYTTDFKYDGISVEQKRGLPNGKIITSIINNSIYDEINYYVVDYKTGKELLKTDNYTGIIGNGNYLYYYVNYAQEYGFDAKIYNSDFKLLFDGNTYEQFGVSSSGNLAIKNKEESTFSIYNKDGKLIKTSKKYKEVGIVMDDYVGVIDDDGYLKIVDYDGNSKVKFIKMTDNYYFHTMISGWNIQDGKEGIFLVVENTNIETGIKGNGLKYYYIPSTKEKGVIELYSITY